MLFVYLIYFLFSQKGNWHTVQIAKHCLLTACKLKFTEEIACCYKIIFWNLEESSGQPFEMFPQGSGHPQGSVCTQSSLVIWLSPSIFPCRCKVLITIFIPPARLLQTQVYTSTSISLSYSNLESQFLYLESTLFGILYFLHSF